MLVASLRPGSAGQVAGTPGHVQPEWLAKWTGIRRRSPKFIQPSGVVRQKPEQVAHGRVDRLLARLVLLERPWSSTKKLTGRALAYAQLLSNLGHLVWAEDFFDIGQ